MLRLFCVGLELACFDLTGVGPGEGSKLPPPVVVHECEPASTWTIPPEVHQQDAMLSGKGLAFAFQVWIQTEDD